MASLNITVIWLIRYHYRNVADFYSNMVAVQAISLEMNQIFSTTENYLLSGNTEYTVSYDRDMRRLRDRVASLKQLRTRFSPAYFALSDIEKILQTFDMRREKLLHDYHARLERIYLSRGTVELGHLPQYVKEQVDLVLAQDLDALRRYFAGVGSNLVAGEFVVFLVIALVILLCIAFSLRFSRQLSVPIQGLARNLRLVAGGQLDLPPLDGGDTDEVAVMVHSFNDMTRRIKHLIERTRDQAETEALIRQRNLEMENVVKQSELDLLQAQINPHFLFNTLNTISALAEMESASKTRAVLDNMSHILRYNLKRSKEIVTLREELETVASYLQIQKVRFSRRLEYSVDAESDCLDAEIPGLVLQPFVENAVIHGLEPSEDVCHISVTVVRSDESIVIRIGDDGVGIAPEPMEAIARAVRDDTSNTAAFKKHFGVSNVCRRLKLFYGLEVVTVESSQAAGTLVSIRIPDGPISGVAAPRSFHSEERDLA